MPNDRDSKDANPNEGYKKPKKLEWPPKEKRRKLEVGSIKKLSQWLKRESKRLKKKKNPNWPKPQ